MKLLEGKKVLIFGIANQRSIAWGIAKVFHEQGAEIGFSYGIPQLEKRVRPLAEQIGVEFIEMCDVSSDDAIDAVFEKAEAHFGKIDVLVHAVAYAPREELMGSFLDTSRSGFAQALDISAYSLVALSRRAVPLMGDGGNVRDWIHVEDHNRAAHLVLERGEVGEIYNIGAHNELTNRDITMRLLGLTDRDESAIEWVPDRLGHDRRYSVNIDKVTALGWKLERDFDAGLEHTVEWYRSNREWWEPLKQRVGL